MKSKLVNFLFIFLFVFSLLGFSILSAIEADESYSRTENRNYTQFEAPSWKTVLDGSWLGFFETYNKDQFFARNTTLQAYNYLLDSIHVNERNGYVKGKDNFVMSVNSSYVSESALKNAQNYGERQVSAMTTIAETADAYGGTVIYLNIPHKIELFTEKYPKFYNNGEQLVTLRRDSIIQKAKNAGITVVETFDLLESHKDEYIYYATDHHWTIRGAYYAYQALLECINNRQSEYTLHFPAFEELNLTVNSDRMVGSYLKKLGDSGIVNVDYMEYALPANMPDYTRYDGGKVSKTPLCDTSNSSYVSFMGGDLANTVIDTNRDDLPSILYIGYSYTNPLEMMSVYNFNRMESLDPRHWSGSICQYIEESKPDYIVIVRDDLTDVNF